MHLVPERRAGLDFAGKAPQIPRSGGSPIGGPTVPPRDPPTAPPRAADQRRSPMQITELLAGSAPRVVEAMDIPPDALVVLVGASGCGKSTFARRHFTDTQVVSSDECRRRVSDDAASQAATREAFAVFYTLVRGRLTHGRLTVADATNLSPRSREKLRQAADSRRRPRVAIALDVPLDLCLARQTMRTRQVRRDVVERGHAEFQQALRDLPHEGFAHVYVVRPDVSSLRGA